MFKKSERDSQIDIFSGITNHLDKKSRKKYDNDKSWHNQFRTQVIDRIDESLFKVLFNDKMGAPNASINILVGMMIMKEAFGWSDSQLFEQCEFNLLVRSALGLYNLNDEIPAESTYYLLRKRIYEYQQQHNEDLLSKTFDLVTSGQVKDFNVNGRSIRMDSKLIGSNIAYFTRYEIIHQTLCAFYKTLDEGMLHLLPASDRKLLKEIFEEEPQKTVYRSTRDEIKGRMQSLGILVYRMIHVFTDHESNEEYQLLTRVFDEQYKVSDNQQVELRPKTEITSDSVQSPHDPDSAYRNKADQKVKGYSVNITETVSDDDSLDLITNVEVDKANVSDTEFVAPAITSTQEVTGQTVEKVYADGAFQSPDNDELCENIDMVYTGIQGAESRYDLQKTDEGLIVTDNLTGELLNATLAKKLKNSKKDKWYIQTENGKRYFDQKMIRTSELRRTMKSRPVTELRKRNNVEATIFQLSIYLRNGKTKYRSLFKQQIWAICRCLWINLVRIVNFLKQTCQRTFQSQKNAVFSAFYQFYSAFKEVWNGKSVSHLSYFVLFIFLFN